MSYVYMREIRNGREEIIGAFVEVDDAIKHMAKCYRIDKEHGQLGEYYYFMVQR